MKPIIAITMGDAAGIGPEICLKAVSSEKLNFCYPIIIGAACVFQKLIPTLNLKLTVNIMRDMRETKFKRGVINILDCGGIQIKKLLHGKTCAMCGLASINYVGTAAALALDGKADAIVTAPLNKAAVRKAKLTYTGHTELLAEIFKTRAVMMFVAGNLRIAVVTRHLPINQVSRSITGKKLLDTIRIIYEARNDLGLENPSIALLSLNPHGGEEGIIGNDEEKKIIPAIHKAQRLGINVNGPFPSDGFFGSGKQKRFDIVIAMYHDQGLIPYKMIAFGHGVNVTLGLPIIRTSVDHGTAYDIAGRGIASEKSMIEAIRFAVLMAKRKRCKV